MRLHTLEEAVPGREWDTYICHIKRWWQTRPRKRGTERERGITHVVEKLMATTLCRVAIDTKTYVCIYDVRERNANVNTFKREKFQSRCETEPNKKRCENLQPCPKRWRRRPTCIFTRFGTEIAAVAATISRNCHHRRRRQPKRSHNILQREINFVLFA